MNYKNKVLDIICNQLKVSVDAVNLLSDFSNWAKIDSLTMVELVLSIEESFDIEISDEEVSKFNNVKSIILYVENVKINSNELNITK
jgi:acyl carrier protein